MTLLAILTAIALVVGIVLLADRRFASHAQPGWTAITDGKDYGAEVDATGSFDIPLAPNSVHYVTKTCDGLTGTGIRLSYRIDAEPGITFSAASEPGAPAIGPTLYFQREGDDWSGIGKFETYRWWATFAAKPLAVGEFEILATFSELWTAVETSNVDNSTDAFREALANAARVGFTFGGGTGYGHGVYATGKARFTLLSFELI